jgi:hypothetical protein
VSQSSFTLGLIRAPQESGVDISSMLTYRITHTLIVHLREFRKYELPREHHDVQYELPREQYDV